MHVAGDAVTEGVSRMNTDVRRKLDMADRVRDFSRAHPTEDPAYDVAHLRTGRQRVFRGSRLAVVHAPAHDRR